MAKEILFERYRWAVFTPANCCLEYTFAFSRAAAIQSLKPRKNENWEEMKKRGWYTARIQMTWQKYQK